MTGIHDLRGFQYDLLVVISGVGTANGQTILAELQSSLSDDVKPGRLYDNLDELVEIGLLDCATEGRSNQYTLTEKGERFVKERHEWEQTLFDEQAGR
ncbi:MAG: helix-turn-helix transcriptional regulator [Haloarculaceae archaeon]